MVNKFFIKFLNGFIHEVNTANEDSARFIAEGLFPGLKIVSIETAV